MVGALEVVDQQDEQPSPRRALQGARDAVEQAEAGLRGVEIVHQRDVRERLAHGRHERGDITRAGAEERSQRVRRPGRHDAAEALDPRPECRGAGMLPASADQDLRAFPPGDACELLQRAGLPDPRLAYQQDHRTPTRRGPGLRGGESGTQDAELAFASDEGPCTAVCHGVPHPIKGWAHEVNNR